jgi:hypothetical protein
MKNLITPFIDANTYLYTSMLIGSNYRRATNFITLKDGTFPLKITLNGSVAFPLSCILASFPFVNYCHNILNPFFYSTSVKRVFSPLKKV